MICRVFERKRQRTVPRSPLPALCRVALCVKTARGSGWSGSMLILVYVPAKENVRQTVPSRVCSNPSTRSAEPASRRAARRTGLRARAFRSKPLQKDHSASSSRIAHFLSLALPVASPHAHATSIVASAITTQCMVMQQSSWPHRALRH